MVCTRGPAASPSVLTRALGVAEVEDGGGTEAGNVPGLQDRAWGQPWPLRLAQAQGVLHRQALWAETGEEGLWAHQGGERQAWPRGFPTGLFPLPLRSIILSQPFVPFCLPRTLFCFPNYRGARRGVPNSGPPSPGDSPGATANLMAGGRQGEVALGSWGEEGLCVPGEVCLSALMSMRVGSGLRGGPGCPGTAASLLRLLEFAQGPLLPVGRAERAGRGQGWGTRQVGLVTFPHGPLAQCTRSASVFNRPPSAS